VSGTTITKVDLSVAPAELPQGYVRAEWWERPSESETGQDPSVIEQAFVLHLTKAHVPLPGGIATLVGRAGLWNGNARGISLGSLVGMQMHHSFTVGEAERRLEQLIAAAAMPTLFASDDPDDDPPAPLSSVAAERTRQILRAAATAWGLMPTGRVSIFPMRDGGIQLQRSGSASSISIEVPPNDGEPVLAEFAASDEYWSKEIDESADVARFLNQTLK
jgi:hypothetical protein